MPSPIPRPSSEMKAGEWNTIDIVLDANILRPFLNDAGGISGGVADEEYGRSGAIALHAGGTGDVRFRDVLVQGPAAESGAYRGGLEPLPDAGAERVLLLVGS